jgi:hypothetical protein
LIGYAGLDLNEFLLNDDAFDSLRAKGLSLYF